MKCIKNLVTGEIKRVSDETAYQLETKGWKYVPKSEWKVEVRGTTEVVKETKLVDGVGKPRRNREKKTRR